MRIAWGFVWSSSFVRSFVATSRHVARPARASRPRVVPPNLEGSPSCDGMEGMEWNGMGAREMVLTGGVLIIVYGTCATNRMSYPSRVLNTQVM